MTTKNCLIDYMLRVEQWGRAFSSPDRRHRALGWLGVGSVSVILLTFYSALNKDSEWASFLVFLLVDCGVSFAALAVILLRPLEHALYPMVSVYSRMQGHDTDALLLVEQEDEEDDEITSLASAVPKRDFPIQLHFAVFVGCVVSSCLSDGIATNHDVPSAPVFDKILFVLADLLENILYCGGFLWLGISYRTIALRVWKLRTELEQVMVLPHLGDESGAMTTTTSNTLALVSRLRQAYEETFEAAESLSHKTSVLALIMISLAVIEMVSTLQNMFHEPDVELDIAHLATMRLLIVLSALLLQVALAAADIIYSSERLSETMAQFEGQIRDDVVKYYSVDTRSLQLLAALLKTLGYRIRSFPVRISVAWFHLTAEWAMGIALLVATILLAVVGIELPGGE